MKTQNTKALAVALFLPLAGALTAFADDAPGTPTPTPATAPQPVTTPDPSASPVPTMPGGGGGK